MLPELTIGRYFEESVTPARILAGMAIVALVAVGASVVFTGRAVQDPVLKGPAKNWTFSSICNQSGSALKEIRWIKSSFAGDDCSVPKEPVVPIGHLSSLKQIKLSMSAAQNYAQAVDEFERCVGQYIRIRRAQSQGADQVAINSLMIIETHRVLVSEASKKKVNDSVKMAIRDYNALGSECP